MKIANPILLIGLGLGLATDLQLQGQGWQRVLHLNDVAGSAIGAGLDDTLYAALVPGQVFRSTDNGLSWIGITNGLVDNSGRMLLPKAFVLTPTGRVLRGGDNASWNNKVGSPIFYSDNQGTQWTEVPLPFGSSTRNPGGIGVGDMVLHKGAIYFADLLSEGVWRSDDNGLTWNVAGTGLPTAPFVNFAKTYYAVASAGDALLTIQASKGVFRSTDGGATWVQAVTGIPGVVDSPLVGGRTWNGSDVTGVPDGTAFAVSDGRLYRSRDGGASWTEIGTGILQSPNPFVPSVLQPSARKVEVLGDRVFVTTTDANPRFFEGTALGDSWTELPRIDGNSTPASVLAQSFYAHNGALYFAGDKGIHRLHLATVNRTNLLPVATGLPTATFYANTGSRLSIPASVQGTAPFTFQWQINGSPIPGQTSATLDFTPATTNDAGNLSLVVSNAAGQATFPFGRLIVAPVGPGQPDLSYRPQFPGDITAMAIGQDGSVFYGGPFFSQLETYTGVRKTFADGSVDSRFVTGAVTGSGSGPKLSEGTPRALLPLANGSVLVGATDTSVNARYYRRLLADGSQDPSWPWPQETAGGPRKIAQLPDGKFLMAGGSTGGIHRLNADGSFDNTFLGPTSIGGFQSAFVSDFAITPDGSIIIVGKFSVVDGEPRVGIARLRPSGSLDTSWIPAQPPVGHSVWSVSVQADGKILLGGNFTAIGNQPYRGLARLNPDGTLNTSVGPILPTGSIVNALEPQPDGKIWVGGQFTGVQGRNHLLRLNPNGTVDTEAPNMGFTTNPTTFVNILRATSDGRLWVGGGLLPIAGQTNANLARFFTDINGPTIGYAGIDQTPDPGTSTFLRATLSGTFTSLQWRFQGNPIPGATGLELPLANLTMADSGLYDLVVSSAGGSHTSAPVSVRVRGPVVIDQPPLPMVVALSNAANFSVTAFGKLPLSYQWFRDGVAVPNATGRTLSLSNLSLSASADYSVRVTAGDGSSAEGGPAYLAVVPAPGSTNASFRPALSTTTTFTTFRDIAFLPNGQAIVGGNFSTTGTGGPNAFLTRLNTDGTVDSTFRFNAAGISDFGAVERQPDGRLVVLLRLSTAPSPFIVRRLMADGSVDSGFVQTEVFFGSDLRLHPDGGVLVVGNSGIERRNADGSVDAGFKQRATMNGQALSADVDPSGRIYVTGYFSTVGGVQRSGLARLLADGTLDSTFVPTQILSSTRVVTALPDGALVGDQSAFYRFAESGSIDLSYPWSTRLSVWDVLPTQQWIGLLNGSEGNGVIRSANGMPGRPFATMKVPSSFTGYSWVRVSPDGSIWLAKGSNGALDPATLLFRLNGLVTPLSILLQPQPQAVLPGGEARLQISASGTSAIRYQWQLNGQDLPGETNSVLVLRNVQAPNVGDYSVRITNASGSLTSQPARVSLIVPPVIAANPTSLVLSEGESAQLSVTAVGVQLRYQWLASATNLPGQTNASLLLSNVGPAQAGPYFVRVTNPAGTNDSLVAKIRIRPQPATGVGAGPANGLVRRWRFENDLTESVSGLTTIPYGTLTYGAGIESASALKVRSGQNWIQMGDGPGLSSRLTDELFTVSFWIKPESEGTINPFSYLMLKRGTFLGTFEGKELTFWLSGTNGLGQGFGTNRLKLGANSMNTMVSADPRAYVPNLVGKWTHFAITYPGGNPTADFSIYLNGQKLVLGGGPFDFTPNNLQNAIGRYTPAATFQMDDFRVYNRALTDAEVASLSQPSTPVPPPNITSHPVAGSANAGAPFTFNVSATGPDLFYEWFRGTNLLANFDGPTLTIPSTTPSDAGDYRVTISNGGGSTNSLTATLTVNAAVDPFVTWAATAGLTGAAAGPDADPDGDGFKNLAEFAYGTDPTSAAVRPQFILGTFSVNGLEYPTLTFTQRRNLGSVQVRVLTSPTLDFSTATQAIPVGIVPAGDFDTVTVRSDLSTTTGSAQFFQIVTGP